jgi:hypothetical protein
MFGILQYEELVESGRKHNDNENEYEIDNLMMKSII